MSKIVFSEDSLIILLIGIIWLLVSTVYGFIGVSLPDAEFLWFTGGIIFVTLMISLLIIETKRNSQSLPKE